MKKCIFSIIQYIKDHVYTRKSVDVLLLSTLQGLRIAKLQKQQTKVHAVCIMSAYRHNEPARACIYTPVNEYRCVLCGVIKSCEVLKRKTGVNKRSFNMSQSHPKMHICGERVAYVHFLCSRKRNYFSSTPERVLRFSFPFACR